MSRLVCFVLKFHYLAGVSSRSAKSIVASDYLLKLFGQVWRKLSSWAGAAIRELRSAFANLSLTVEASQGYGGCEGVTDRNWEHCQVAQVPTTALVSNSFVQEPTAVIPSMPA